VIADALRGLLAVQPGGAVVVLADSVALEPIRYADAVVVAGDGRILFTDASKRFSPHERGTFDAALLDILEQSCTGRVLEYDPASAATRIIANVRTQESAKLVTIRPRIGRSIRRGEDTRARMRGQNRIGLVPGKPGLTTDDRSLNGRRGCSRSNRQSSCLRRRLGQPGLKRFDLLL
jgi:hypothetical protein